MIAILITAAHLLVQKEGQRCDQLEAPVLKVATANDLYPIHFARRVKFRRESIEKAENRLVEKTEANIH